MRLHQVPGKKSKLPPAGCEFLNMNSLQVPTLPKSQDGGGRGEGRGSLEVRAHTALASVVRVAMGESVRLFHPQSLHL